MMNFIHRYKPLDLTTTDLGALEMDLVELLTRRRFIIGAGGLLGAAALGACGAGGEAAVPTAATEAARTITHALGETEVPARAERIVSISISVTGPLLAANAPVIGSQGSIDLTGDPTGFFPAYADVARERDVQLLYESFEPNLEAIAAAQPDVIIGSADDAAGAPSIEVYDQLSAIAPTILFNFSNIHWQDIFVEIAGAVGYGDEAQARLTEYQELEREVAATITLPPQPTSIVTKTPGNPNFFLIPPDFSPSVLLAGIGFEIVEPPGYEPGTGFVPVSDELITDAIAGRSLFYIEVAGAVPFAELRQQPLWAQVPAVRDGHAYVLPFQVVRPDPYVAPALLRDFQERFR
ncbi:MAG: ABC transporter substrate-binding protein [Chloroflexales bacterium]|nr:ABC transporter substrate-binding protein [Chloroflexales bacterium]